MRNAELTKQKILDAAEVEFVEKGLYGARVDQIASRSQVNKQLIYAYFHSKEKLYTEVLIRVYNRLVEREKQLLADVSDCVQAIRNIISMYFEFLGSDPSFVRIVMWENLNKGKYIHESGVVFIKDCAFQYAKQVLESGIRQGVFREDTDIQEFILSLNMFAFSYFSNIHTMTQLMHSDYFSPERISKRAEYVTWLLLGSIMSTD
jgi:TetR/AcrR family transcriptional regulator